MNYLRKSAKVVSHNYDADSQYTTGRQYVNEHMGDTGVIVDYSNSHGECFGLVFPNEEGSYSREYQLEILWFEPNEVEIQK